MKRIWRVISNFSNEHTAEGSLRLTPYEEEMVEMILERHLFLKYDGKVCHWNNGDMMYAIAICTDEEIEEFKRLDNKMHEGFDGWTTFDDITEEVLYDVFDTSVFGFLEDVTQYDFYVYRTKNLTKDIVLDKCLKHGVGSLTSNDKRLLNDEEMIPPFDDLD